MINGKVILDTATEEVLKDLVDQTSSAETMASDALSYVDNYLPGEIPEEEGTYTIQMTVDSEGNRTVEWVANAE